MEKPVEGGSGMQDGRHSRTILIVDDHQGFLSLLQHGLSREGFQTETACSGQEALAWLTHHRADLLLLDLQLPDMTGEDLIQHLEQRHITLPFLVITGQGDERRAVQMMKQGARDYFIKDHRVVECLPSIVTQTFEQIEQEQQFTHTQEALRMERERMAITLASIHEGVLTTDTQGCLTYMNRMAETLTGRESQHAMGRPIQDIVRFDSHHAPIASEHPVTQVLQNQTPLNATHPHFLIQHPTGDRPVVCSASPLRETDGTLLGCVLIIRDITERLKFDQEGLKISQLESLGTLAGGIAHDFNNYLTAILGNISLTKTRLNSRDHLYEYLSEAEDASLKAKGLTHQLLTFAKGGHPLKKPLSLLTLVQEAARLALTGSSIHSKLILPENLWTVNADGDQLRQVIHNLVMNARQSMDDDGTVTLQGQNLILSEGEVRHYRLSKPGPYIKLTIQDTGNGIASHLLRNIFDPYFTTRIGGSGLGLSTAYSIIKHHQGTITASSLQGEGSTFHIYLPADPTSAPPSTPRPPLPTGEGRILVMDDEASIRLVLGEMLQHLGYEVHCVAEGQEAIERYQEAYHSQRPFSAVILDLTVPSGLGGKDTIQQLRDFDPHVKAIVASGYSQDVILSQYSQYGFHGVVAKPFRLNELSQALQHITP